MDFSSFLAQEEENEEEEVMEKDTMEVGPAVNPLELRLRKRTRTRTNSLLSETQSIHSEISVMKELPSSQSEVAQTKAEEEGTALPPKAEKEMRSSGSVNSGIYTSYFVSGTNWAAFIFMIFTNILCQGLYSYSDIWLSFWTAEEKEKLAKSLDVNPGESVLPPPALGPNITSDNSQVVNSTLIDTSLGNHYFNLGVYGAIIGALCVSSMVRCIYFFVMCMKSSIKLHDNMFESVIRAPCRFFDTNPVGEYFMIFVFRPKKMF